MDGRDGGDVGLVVFGAFLACEGGFETRPYVASLSLRGGEEGVLVWPAGVLQVLEVWLGVVGAVREPPLRQGFFIAALAGIGRGPVL